MPHCWKHLGSWQGRRSLWERGTCLPQYLWRGTFMVMSPPNILEVMSFRMSTQVTATVVCCILMQILCVVSQKSFSYPIPGLRPWTPLGTSSPRLPTGALPLDTAGGLPSPRPTVFFMSRSIILWDRRPWFLTCRCDVDTVGYVSPVTPQPGEIII